MKKSLLLFVMFLCISQLFAQSGGGVFIKQDDVNKFEKYSDEFFIENGYVKNNILEISVVYAGGCAEHDFYYSFAENDNDTLTVRVFHDAKKDVCHALVGKFIEIDLSVISDLTKFNFIKVVSGKSSNHLALYPLFRNEKLRLSDAELLLKKYSENNQITELTNDEVWNKMNTQLYQIENDSIMFFAITNKTVTYLGGHYSYDFNYEVCDLDSDGNFECIYTYQFGSGVSRGVLGGYSNNQLLKIDNSCIIPSKKSISWFRFIKHSDYSLGVYVQTPSEKMMFGNLLIENKLKIILKSQ